MRVRGVENPQQPPANRQVSAELGNPIFPLAPASPVCEIVGGGCISSGSAPGRDFACRGQRMERKYLDSTQHSRRVLRTSSVHCLTTTRVPPPAPPSRAESRNQGNRHCPTPAHARGWKGCDHARPQVRTRSCTHAVRRTSTGQSELLLPGPSEARRPSIEHLQPAPTPRMSGGSLAGPGCGAAYTARPGARRPRAEHYVGTYLGRGGRGAAVFGRKGRPSPTVKSI